MSQTTKVTLAIVFGLIATSVLIGVDEQVSTPTTPATTLSYTRGRTSVVLMASDGKIVMMGGVR